MIVKEFYKKRKDGVDLYRTSSDKGVMIRKCGTDEEFVAAIDVDGSPFVYEETEHPIAQEEDNENED